STGTMVDHGDFPGNWVSFGEDINKALYIISIGGDIYKVIGGEIAGANDFSMENSLNMFPNPAKNEITFTLEMGTIQSISLSDLGGRIVFSDENISASNKTIAIDNLNAGIYFAQLTSGKGQSIIKKIIVH